MTDIKRPYPLPRPKEYINRATLPITRFVKIDATAGPMLIFFTVFALILANSPLNDFYVNIWKTPIGIHIEAIEFGNIHRHNLAFTLEQPNTEKLGISIASLASVAYGMILLRFFSPPKKI